MYLKRLEIFVANRPFHDVAPIPQLSQLSLWPLVPETISSDLTNLLKGRQKTLQPSQVQPVQ